jgi:hypothetical protein
LIVLVAHLPIVIFAVALLPAFLLGFTLHPARYADALSGVVGRLQAWSCAVVAATSSDTSGTTSECSDAA